MTALLDLPELPEASQTHGSATIGMVRGPMQRPEWLAAAIETLGQTHLVERVTVDDTRAGHAEATLMRPRGDCRQPWVMPGVDELNEPTDLVYDSPAALELLVRELVRRGMPLRLPRIRRDSPTIAALQRAVGSLGAVVLRPRANYPTIELNSAWSEPESQLSSRRRSDFRRAAKRAEELGEVRSELIVPTLDNLDSLMQLALDVEARSWKGEAGTALQHDPHRAAFFANYARRACEQGILRLNFLHIGAQVAAMQIAVEVDGGLWLLKVGYDPEFARCSPGNLLIAATIQAAVESGLKSYEFLGTAEAWTRVWTEHEHETVAVSVYPASLASAAVALTDAVRIARRRMQSKVSQ